MLLVRFLFCARATWPRHGVDVSCMDDPARAGEWWLAPDSELFRRVVEHAHEGVWVCGPDGRTIYANPRMAELLGCPPAELAERSVWDFLDPEASLSVRSNLNRRRRGASEQHERRYVRADGSELLALVSASPLVAPDGTHAGSFAIVTDITDRVRSAEVLAEREARLRALFEHSAVGQLLADPGGRIIQANSAFAAMLGYDTDTLVGQSVLELTVEEDRDEAAELARQLLAQRVSGYDYETRHRRSNGEEMYAYDSVGAVRGADGALRYLTVVVQDVTGRKHAEARLAAMALRDPVTGLANRSAMMSFLGDAVEHKTLTAVLFADLDGFKAVNDTLGHAAGDRLLQAVASRLSSSLRPGDMLARFGGDEFVAAATALPSEDDARKLAGRMARSLGRPLEVDGFTLKLSASVGLAWTARRSIDVDTLLRRADLAMYAAKRAGFGDWAEFEPSMAAEVEERLRRQAAVRLRQAPALPPGGALIS